MWTKLARLADPDSSDPDEGGDMSGSRGPQVRSRFVSSAYWAPALLTGDDGVVRFEFDAPDNLTAFRLMAVAADAADGFGAGDARLTVDKPLMATPVLPRFVGAGDQLSVGIVLHNRTGKAGTAEVTIEADGLTLSDTTEEIAVAAGGAARVRFPATADDAASATVKISATMNGEADALQLTLPIRRPRLVDVTTLVEGVGDGTAVTVPVAVAAGTLRDESEVVISVDRTGLGELEPSLRYLVEYPYGCLEQTLSRFVPLAKAKDLSKSLGFKSLAGTKMNTFIAAGVAKLARHQHEDGHFSLWPDSETHPHLTVYALWGLTEARKAGADVPDETMARGLAALTAWLDERGTIAPGEIGATAAMGAWVLAENGKPATGAIEKLHDLRVALPGWGKAFLLRAMIAGKSDADLIADVEAELIRAIKIVDGVASITDDGGDEGHYYMSSATRTTAMVLAALIARDKESSYIGPLVEGLRGSRDADGDWGDTQSNVWSLLALSEYARTLAKGSGWVTIEAGGKRLLKEKLTGAEVQLLRTPLAKAGDELTIDADDGVRFAARLVAVRVDDGAAVSKGFTVQREYLVGGNPVSEVAAGELVTVRLSVTIDAEQQWIALVDPLPAGLEPVNPRLAGGDDDAMTTSGWLQWAHVEQRDDRVLWFADHADAGTYQLTYQARATIDGSFSVPPATIEAMYRPEVRGRTAQASFKVTP
jgi:uncharacterized protein YfaS (alpha-2-macroglobulin family)